ncbi:MAG: ABC-2 transporter permease [Blautia sp.]|nr:ABC-2 transporter permease [Blautia sp.]
MKGLLVKDFRLMKGQKNFLILLFIMIAFVFISGMDASFFMGYLPFLFMIAAMSTITYDEFDNGMAFLMVLPISRKLYVQEKYLFGGVLGFTGLASAFVLFLISEINKGSSMTFTQYVLLFLCFLAFVILFLCLMIPIQLKFGSEKGRIVLFIIFFGIIGIVYLVSKITDKIPAQIIEVFRGIQKLPFGILAALAVGIYILALFISLKISLGIMEKKEW